MSHVKRGTRSLAAVALLMLASLAPAPVLAQAADYTLESAVGKLYKWGVAAVGYSEYRWKKESKELVDSLVGSTIQMSRVPVDAGEIKVGENGRAVVPGVRMAGSLRLRARFGLEPAQARATVAYYTDVVDDGVNLTIADTSDRLALELSGKTDIDVIGRIREASIATPPGWSSLAIQLTVDITSWKPSR